MCEMEYQLVVNACNWMRLHFHSLTCSEAPGKCPLCKRCSDCKRLLSHAFRCSSCPCSSECCFATKQLLLHYCTCQVDGCPVCCSVHRDLWRDTNVQASSAARCQQRGQCAAQVVALGSDERQPVLPTAKITDCTECRNSPRKHDLSELSYFLNWLLCSLFRKDAASSGSNTHRSRGKQLWTHLLTCSSPECGLPLCRLSKGVLVHRLNCAAADCQLCASVCTFFQTSRPVAASPRFEPTNIEELNRQLAALST